MIDIIFFMWYYIFIMWATIRIQPKYTDENGREMTGAEIKAAAVTACAESVRAARTTYNRHKDRITARAAAVYIYAPETGARVFPCIYSALRYIHAQKIDYLFSADGVQDFSFFDYMCLGDKKRWKRAETRREIMEANNGRYRKITGWNFEELSGESGQRYVLKIWTKYPDKRGRYVTRGFNLYDFSNFFSGNIEALARDFGIQCEEEPTETLYKCIEKYSETLETVTGEKFLQDGKPAAMTAGGIAKRALLREMYGNDDYRANLRAFKKDHPINAATDLYFKYTHLMRGGTCWINNNYKRQEIAAPLFKIDRNSSYTAEAAEMPDLCGEIRETDINEYFHPLKEYEYICTVDGIKMRAREGVPAFYFNPITGRNPRFINIEEKLTFFKQELDRIAELYEIEYINITAVFRIVKRENKGIKRYAEKMYNGKNNAKYAEEPALYAVYKSLNVCAWGKLAQRADFPTVIHRIHPKTGAIVTITRPCEEEDARPALSIILGAYITMRARLSLWDTALKCGGKEPLKTLLYMDSDSVHALLPPPESVAIGDACGEWKIESGKNGAVFSFYADRKAYFNILSFSPFEVVEHVRGIPSQSIKELRARFTAKGHTEAHAETIVFKANAAFLVPVSTSIKGGRAILYVPQRLSTAGKIRTEADRKLIFAGKKFIEI